MARKRKRKNHSVPPNRKLRSTPLWQVHRMLADHNEAGKRKLIRLLAIAGHPDTDALIIEFTK